MARSSSGLLSAALRSGKGLGHVRDSADFRRWIRDRLDHGLSTRRILLRKLGSQYSRTSVIKAIVVAELTVLQQLERAVQVELTQSEDGDQSGLVIRRSPRVMQVRLQQAIRQGSRLRQAGSDRPAAS